MPLRPRATHAHLQRERAVPAPHVEQPALAIALALCNEERKVEALRVVEAWVAVRFVVLVQLLLEQVLRSSYALCDVLKFYKSKEEGEEVGREREEGKRGEKRGGENKEKHTSPVSSK